MCDVQQVACLGQERLEDLLWPKDELENISHDPGSNHAVPLVLRKGLPRYLGTVVSRPIASARSRGKLVWHQRGVVSHVKM